MWVARSGAVAVSVAFPAAILDTHGEYLEMPAASSRRQSDPGGNSSRSQVEWRAEFGRGSVNSQNREGPAHHTEDQRQSQNRPALAGLYRQRLGVVERHHQNRHSHDKSRDRPGNADVEKIFAAVNRRAQADHTAHPPEQRRKRDATPQPGLFPPPPAPT